MHCFIANLYINFHHQFMFFSLVIILCNGILIIYALFQDPLNRAAAPPIMEKAKKPNKQQAASTADLYKQVVSSCFISVL